MEEILIRGGDIPVGMESFPAADEEQFEFIKSIIDDCDYYILIVGGRYGTTHADGMSYTEKEFRYSVSKQIPVLVFPHGNPGTLAAMKSEQSDDGKKKLKEFLTFATEGRLHKSWTSVDGLKLEVRSALDHVKATKARPGWVRGDTAATPALLNELHRLTAENDKLNKRVGEANIRIPMPDLPAIGDLTSVKLHFTKGGSTVKAEIVGTWLDLFPLFYSTVSSDHSDWDGSDHYYIDVDKSRKSLARAIEEIIGGVSSRSGEVTEDSFETLRAFYVEVGLVRPDGDERLFPENADKLARRYRIAGNSARTSLKLIGGSLPKVPSVDDEIPF